MASDTTTNFFLNGTSKQFDYVLKLYPKVLKMKADIRSKKPDELIKLDDWYQHELPRLIKKRGKDAHMVHEELVQTMKWKQSRGKFYPQLSYLIKVNTPRAVMLETKKAFKKLPNLEQAITALSNLKGVGTTMASALLAAASPENAPFMADECLMAIPEIEGIDYTTKEYLNFVEHIQSTVRRLNAEKDRTASGAPDGEWSPHRVELAMWTHYVARELKPELLDDIPPHTASTNGTSNNTATVTTAATTTTTTDDEDEDLEFEDQNVKVINTKVPEGQNLDNTDDDSSSNLVDSTSTIPVLAKNGENGNHKLSPSSSPLPPSTNGILLDINCHNQAAATLKIDENSTTTTTTTRSDDDDSIDNNKSITPIIVANDETNDSDSQSSAKRSLDCEESSTSEEQTDDLRSGEPQIKKIKADN